MDVALLIKPQDPMEQATETSIQPLPSPFRKWGFWSVVFGALALVLVFIQLVGPTLEPSPSAASKIGEIAGEIKRSAWRTLIGLPAAEPAPEAVPIWNYFAIAAPILGTLALVLSLVSGVLRENWRYPVYGAGLGASAIVFQFLWWIVLVVCGVMLLIAILENLGDIFSF